MNRKHIFVIGLVVLIIVLAAIKMCKNMNFEGFGNIVVSKAPAETKIVKFSQPKQTDVLNVTTSDGQQHKGAIAYKVDGVVPEYQKFPIDTEQCSNTYSTTTQQQYITPYLYPGKLAFTSDKVNSNVYLGADSGQSWSIILAGNATTNCTVYIASNTNDIGLNPPYYLEVEAPKSKAWAKKISTTTVNKPGAIKNNILGDVGNYKGRLTPSVKVTTIKNDINALWLIEKVSGIEFLRADFSNILTGGFEFLELILKVARDERKQFIQTMIEGLKPVTNSATSIDSFIAQLEGAVPNDAALATFGISGNVQGVSPHEFIVQRLSDSLKELDQLYRIKSVPFNLYLTANKSGGGIYRGSVTLNSGDESMNSANSYWKITPTSGGVNTPIVEGFDVANFIKNISAKKGSYKPVLVSDSYPTISNADDAVAAGWDAKYADAWQGHYIYRGTSLDNPKELIKVDLNSENGIQGGRGTITAGNKVYNVKHVTKDELIADANNGDTLRAKLVAGTSVNKGRPVMVFLVNGENICGSNSENQEQYCSKIDGDEVSNYQDQYQAAGIKMLDMKSGLGIPQVDLSPSDPNPCTNQNNNPITKECAQFLYYGKAYKPGSDQWKENSCTNKNFFENTLWSDLQGKDLAYGKGKIQQIQQRANASDPKYLNNCKGDTLGNLDGKFVKSKDGSQVYYIYNAMAYMIPTPGACFPGDHTSSEVVTLTDDQLNEINEFKSTQAATPASSNPNVAAACIARSVNGKAIAVEGYGTIFVVYGGKKYWLPSYGACGPSSESNKVIRSYKGTNFSTDIVNAIPAVSKSGTPMIGNSAAITNYNNMAQATRNSSDPNMATYCQNAVYGQSCPMNTPYVYNADGKKGTYCCSVEPSTSTYYPPGTFDSCSSGKNTPCQNPPCSTNPEYTGEGAEAWGTNLQNTIWNKPKNTTDFNKWKEIRGELKWVDGTGKDYVWGTSEGDNIYACKQPCSTGAWKQVTGELVQVSVDTQNNVVYGVNKSSNIYWQPADTTTNKWKQIPIGILTNISASGYNWIWGVNAADYNIAAARKGTDAQAGKWQMVPGKLLVVSADNQGTEAASNVYGISPNTPQHEYASIYRHNINPSKGGWIRMTDGAPGTRSNPNTYIDATNRVWLYVTLKNSAIYRALKSDPPMKMRWQKVNGWLRQISVGNNIPIKRPMVMYGGNIFLRFPSLVDSSNPSGRYLSGNRTEGNAEVLVNPNSAYESSGDKGYTFIASKQLYGSTGSGPVKYGDVFALKCASMGRFLSGSRGVDRGINTENPKTSYEANNIAAAQKAMNEKPQGKTNYTWSFVPGKGNTNKKGYPVLYGDQVMLVMSLWNGDALTAFSNRQVHNYPPGSAPYGSTNQMIIDQVWRYPSEL